MSATETIPGDDEVVDPAPARLPAVPERRPPAPKGKAKSAPREPKHAKSAPRTTRVVLRKLDAWSVLKLSLVFYLALFIVVLVAGVILWAGANSVGVVENIESFMQDIGFNDFKFVPDKLLGGIALGGMVLVVAGTCANVLLAALFNLMGDIVGGLKLTLQEEPDAKSTIKARNKAAAKAKKAEDSATADD
jgi:hypothetical protein